MFSKTMTIYMKSGNVITIKGVKSYKITRCDVVVNYLYVTRTFFYRNMKLEHLSLDQIEAIVVK